MLRVFEIFSSPKAVQIIQSHRYEINIIFYSLHILPQQYIVSYQNPFLLPLLALTPVQSPAVLNLAQIVQ